MSGAEQNEEREQVNQAEQSRRASGGRPTAEDEPLLPWHRERGTGSDARMPIGPATATAADLANGATPTAGCGIRDGGVPMTAGTSLADGAARDDDRARDGQAGDEGDHDGTARANGARSASQAIWDDHEGGASGEGRGHVTAGDDTPIMRQAETAVMVQSRRSERLREPADTRVLIVANQKGGVGKTTTAVNLAAALSVCGLRVLVVDLDPQGNATTALGIDRWTSDLPSIYDALVDGKRLADVVRKVDGYESLYCVPATIDLAGAEIELVAVKARESRLRSVLSEHLTDDAGASRYDYVFIDCPPSLGLLTVNALVGGDEVLIPIQCEYYALEGLSQLLSNIELVQSHLNPGLEVSTILLTMFDGRTRLAAQVVDEVRKHFGETALRTMIPRSVRISEAPSYGQTVLTYDPGSSGAMSYLDAARELTERVATSGRDGVAGVDGGAVAGPAANPAGGDNDVLIERKS